MKLVGRGRGEVAAMEVWDVWTPLVTGAMVGTVAMVGIVEGLHVAMVVEEDSLVWELGVSLCSISNPNRFSVCNLTSESHDEWLR